MADFVASVESISSAMNLTERQKISRMYDNWRRNKVFRDPLAPGLGNEKIRSTLA